MPEGEGVLPGVNTVEKVEVDEVVLGVVFGVDVPLTAIALPAKRESIYTANHGGNDRRSDLLSPFPGRYGSATPTRRSTKVGEETRASENSNKKSKAKKTPKRPPPKPTLLPLQRHRRKNPRKVPKSPPLMPMPPPLPPPRNPLPPSKMRRKRQRPWKNTGRNRLKRLLDSLYPPVDRPTKVLMTLNGKMVSLS